jgi:pSer/pThr/pTyr-binding forkhead associated (FHA) protein
MLVIAVNTLYAMLRKRGTRRQLTGGVVVCVVCALLLLVAITWYAVRFNPQQAIPSLAEVEIALVYVALLGWFVPIGTCISFCFFSTLRVQTSSVEIPSQGKRTRASTKLLTPLNPPRHRADVAVPLVYDEDTPWSWLEYRAGRLQGQRLALKRAIVTIGRDEDNDIWIDDEQASRHHAELAWDQGKVYITDCDSMNGVFLDGKRVRQTAFLQSGALIGIGEHLFLFTLAESPSSINDAFDPLANHVWRPSFTASSEKIAMPSRLLNMPSMPSLPSITVVPRDTDVPPGVPRTLGISKKISSSHPALLDTGKRQATTPLYKLSDATRTGATGILMFRSGEHTGETIVLSRSLITLGRSAECDISLQDDTVSWKHAQFVRQVEGYFVQDVESQNGTFVNEELLTHPCLLKTGDVIRAGTVSLAYAALPVAQSPASLFSEASPRPLFHALHESGPFDPLGTPGY